MFGLALDSNGLKIAKDVTLLHSRLERLFFTTIGDQIGYLDQGSRVLDYFWEGATIENAQAILFEVKTLLKMYEPNLIPISMMVTFSPVIASSMALFIDLEFYWKDNENLSYSVSLVKVKE